MLPRHARITNSDYITLSYVCPQCHYSNNFSRPKLQEGIIVTLSTFWCKKCQIKIEIAYQYTKFGAQVIGPHITSRKEKKDR